MSASPPREQGRFRQFHDRMFALGRPTAAVVAQARARGRRRAPPAPTAAGRAELARNIELARALGATGTPTFVVGDQVLQGAVGYEALKAAIAAARARRAEKGGPIYLELLIFRGRLSRGQIPFVPHRGCRASP